MTKIHCPFWVKTSHGRNDVAFKADSEHVLAKLCDVQNVKCLDVQLDRFLIRHEKDNSYVAEAHAPGLSKDLALRLLSDLGIALTALLGERATNAYYGTPYVEIDLYNTDISEEAKEIDPYQDESGVLHFADRVRMTDKVAIKVTTKTAMGGAENYAINDADVSVLRADSLRQLFADGLRASTAESKYFHWFIILEEFLENNQSLNVAFTPLYDDTDKAKITALANELGSRKGAGIKNCLRLTFQNRHEKLAAILNSIGIAQVSAPGSEIAITPDVCENLIKQRNKLFHKGVHIDEGPLYNVLFPIVRELARRSAEFVR